MDVTADQTRQRKTNLKGANTAKPNPAHDDDHYEDSYMDIIIMNNHDHGLFDANRVISDR